MGALLFAPSLLASDSNCFGLNEGCFGKRTTPVAGSTSSRVQINPSSVPIDDGYGIGGIFYKNDVDLLLVHGNGKVGAALSPANSESTFFGAPGLEIPDNYLSRRIQANKYSGQKLTLAMAVALIGNADSSDRKFTLRLGLMGKYNKETFDISPGAGLSGSMGPFPLATQAIKM
jgi:hypothetical protein